MMLTQPQRRFVASLATATVVVLAGCGNANRTPTESRGSTDVATSKTLRIAIANIPPPEPTGVITGTGFVGVLGSVNGCVGLPDFKDGSGRRTLLVWPSGTSGTIDEGRFAIQANDLILRVGDKVDFDSTGLVNLSNIDIPAKCKQDARGLYVSRISKVP